MPRVHDSDLSSFALEDEPSMSRIGECKREGFPRCLEVSLLRIFGQCSEDALVEKITHRLRTLGKGNTPVGACSANQVWMIYDQVLREIGRELGV